LWLQAANNSEDKLYFDKSHLVFLLLYSDDGEQNFDLFFSVLIQQGVPVA